MFFFLLFALEQLCPVPASLSVVHYHALRMHVQCTKFRTVIGGDDNCLLLIDFSIEIVGYYW
jgi:hypothetical protein